MDRMESEYLERIGSVKAAIHMYVERSQGGKLYKTKAKLSVPEDFPSKARELHLARRDIGMLSDSKRSAENEMARAKSELSNAKRTAKELVLQIEEFKARARARVRKKELEKLKRPIRGEEEWAMSGGEVQQQQYIEVIRELENVKQELSNIRLGMASVVEAKAKAVEETETSGLKMKSCLKSVEELSKGIDEVNEEHVLVELARIEALKEFREIEAQREAEMVKFSQKLEETKGRIKDLVKEINHAKELEMKLVVTTSDLDVLQNEMVFVRAMDKNFQTSPSEPGSKSRWEVEMESECLLENAEAELGAAKKELDSIKEEGFQFMASMDVVRVELNRVSNEVSRLKKLEEKADITVHNLNSKLLRVKLKLKTASAAEQKAKGIVSNLSAALERLRNNMEEAKKEKEQIVKEAENLKLEMEKINSNSDLVKERLIAAMQELEAVKASEAAALDRLKTLSEKTMMTRASAAENRSTITIPKFESEYLSKSAAGAQEVADKKVAAAQAWVEALQASEKEILLQTEVVKREVRDIRELEEKELDKMEKVLATEIVEQRKRRQLGGKSQAEKVQPLPPRKSFKEYGMTPTSRKSRIHRRSLSPEKALSAETSEHHNVKVERDSPAAKVQLTVTTPRKSFKENGATPRKLKMQRRSSSSINRSLTNSPSITLRKRRKVMPSLVKLLRGRKAGKQKSG